MALRRHPLLVEPDVEFAGVEPHETTDLDEWDPALGHQPTNVARRDAKGDGNLVRVEQWCALRPSSGRV